MCLFLLAPESPPYLHWTKSVGIGTKLCYETNPIITIGILLSDLILCTVILSTTHLRNPIAIHSLMQNTLEVLHFPPPHFYIHKQLF